jgi:anti-sigma28 factor (negative regulator of flagellin synthesis)
MDPTRLDPKKNARPALLKVASPQGGAVGKTQSAAEVVASQPAQQPVVSVETQSFADPKVEARRLDSKRFAELREALKNDTYKVDVGGLARLMVEEALGPESSE